MKKRYFNLLILLLLSIIAAGCQGSTGEKGTAPEGSIALAEGSRTSGTWQSSHCSVKYNYLRTGSNLDLTGHVSLASNVTTNYPVIDSFHLQAHMFDRAGKVLGSHTVMNTGSASNVDPQYNLPFQTTIALPTGASSVAFSYTGRASYPDKVDGAIYEFSSGP